MATGKTVQYQFQADITDIINKLEKIQQTAGTAFARVNDSGRNAGEKLAQAFNTLNIRPFKDIQADINQVTNAMNTLKNSGTLTGAELGRAMTAGRTKIAALKAEMTGAAQQTGFLATRLQSMAAIAGTLVFSFFTRETFRQFGEFDTNMRNVWTLTSATQDEMNSASEAILDMTKRLPESAIGLSKALYDVVSAGVELSDSLGVVELASKAATAGLSDTQTAARIGVQIMNAYGKTVDDLGGIYDNLFFLVKRSVTTFEEVAQYIGTIVPVAAKANISLEELTSSLAVLTQKGIRLPLAVTGLRFAILSLVNPTKETAEAMEIAGVKWEGLLPTLKRLKEAGFDTTEALGRLGIPKRSFAQLLTLIDSVDLLDSRIIELGNSTNLMQDAAEKAFGSFTNQMEIAKNTFREFAIRLGSEMAPAVVAITQSVGKIVELFLSLPEPVRRAIEGIVALTIALKALTLLSGITTTLLTFNGALSSMGVILSTVFPTIAAMGAPALVALAVALGTVTAAVLKFRKEWQQTWETGIDFAKLEKDNALFAKTRILTLEQIKDTDTKTLQAYEKALINRQRFLTAALQQMEADADSVIGRLREKTEQVLNWIIRAYNFIAKISPAAKLAEALGADVTLQEVDLTFKADIANIEQTIKDGEAKIDEVKQTLENRAKGIEIDVTPKFDAKAGEKALPVEQLRLISKQAIENLEGVVEKWQDAIDGALDYVQKITGATISQNQLADAMARTNSVQELIAELQKETGFLTKKENESQEEHEDNLKAVFQQFKNIYNYSDKLEESEKNLAAETAKFTRLMGDAKGETAATADELEELSKIAQLKTNKEVKELEKNFKKSGDAGEKAIKSVINSLKKLDPKKQISLELDGTKFEGTVAEVREKMTEELKRGGIQAGAEIFTALEDTSKKIEGLFYDTKYGRIELDISENEIAKLQELPASLRELWLQNKAEAQAYKAAIGDTTPEERMKDRLAEIAAQFDKLSDSTVKQVTSAADVWGASIDKMGKLWLQTDFGAIQVETDDVEKAFDIFSDGTEEMKQKFLEAHGLIREMSDSLKNIETSTTFEPLVEQMEKLGVSADKVKEIMQNNTEVGDQYDALIAAAGENIDKNVSGEEKQLKIGGERLDNMRSILDLLNQQNDALKTQEGLLAQQKLERDVMAFAEPGQGFQEAMKKYLAMTGRGFSGGLEEYQEFLKNPPKFEPVQITVPPEALAPLDLTISKLKTAEEQIGTFQQSVIDAATQVAESGAADVRDVLAIDEMANGLAEIEVTFGETIDNLNEDTQEATDKFKEGMEQDNEAVNEWLTNRSENMNSFLGDITAAAQTLSDDLYNILAEVMRRANEIANEVTRAKANASTLMTATGGLGFAVGGLVSGARGVDNVPAWLTAGEFVIKKSIVDKYGLAFFQSLNKGLLNLKPVKNIPAFAMGGLVGGTPALSTTPGTPANTAVKSQATIMNVIDPELIESIVSSDKMENFILNVIKGNSRYISEWIN